MPDSLPLDLAQDHGPLTERQAALVLYECLKVVAACHGEGLVHGDVKPANFLLKQRMRNPLALVESGSVRSWLKAIDFGCSQDTRGAQLSRRTGTPGVHPLPLPIPPQSSAFACNSWGAPSAQSASVTPCSSLLRFARF
jgi:serine/threonine protein kinase